MLADGKTTSLAARSMNCIYACSWPGKRFTYCSSNGAVYRLWGEHTVCKRNKAEVRVRRLDIEQRAEEFLRKRGELTDARHWAINQARFEIARIAWAA